MFCIWHLVPVWQSTDITTAVVSLYSTFEKNIRNAWFYVRSTGEMHDWTILSITMVTNYACVFQVIRRMYPYIQLSQSADSCSHIQRGVQIHPRYSLLSGVEWGMYPFIRSVVVKSFPGQADLKSIIILGISWGLYLASLWECRHQNFWYCMDDP